jgi:stage V sporulation protein G
VVTEVQIMPVKPASGLVAFASVVIDNKLYLGSIAVYKRLDVGYRITYPTKKLGERQLNIYHPINKKLGLQIELAITAKCDELFQGSDEYHDRHGQTATPRGSVQPNET